MSATDTINITNLIDSRPISKYQASVFVLCALAALMDGFDSVIIGITAPAIAKTLGLDVKMFGPIFSAAQFGFMLGAFIAGPLAERLGRKSILILSVAVFGTFALLTPLSGSYEHLVMLRLLTGLGLGGASATFVSISTEYAPWVRARSLPRGRCSRQRRRRILLSAIARSWMPVYIGGITHRDRGLMVAFVPESISLVAAAHATPSCSIVRRIAPDRRKPGTMLSPNRSFRARARQPFADGRAHHDLLLGRVLLLLVGVDTVSPGWCRCGKPASRSPRPR
jgi:AAHS family 4-hydroxybenzoate transporter-like MFS transporter